MGSNINDYIENQNISKFKEPGNKYQKKLDNWLFEFAVKVIKSLQKLPNSPEFRVIHYQLIKSATSAGANYEESQAASSKLDFRNKIYISLKEMRETNYWLRIMAALEMGDLKLIKTLIKESEELKKILGSITSKLDGKR